MEASKLWPEKTAKKILYWMTGIYVVVLFLLSYLAAEHDYLTDETAIKILMGFGALTIASVLQMVIASEGQQRREMVIGLGLTLAWLIYKCPGGINCVD